MASNHDQVSELGSCPYDRPVKPFYLDKDGDVVDANGWLVCCPAYSVWANDDEHREAICAALNSSL